MKEHLFGDIFARDNLSFADRELVTVSALSGIKGVEPQLKAHIKGARNIGLSAEEMRKRLVKIGADCPFFVDDVPAFATGVGEELSPLPEGIPQLEGKWLLLVKPEDHVSTKEAYAHVPVAKAPVDLHEAIRRPIEEWRGLISNDFEKSVLPGHPKIAAIRQTLYDLHAIYASMTGSGSAVYGFFDNSVPDPDVVFDGCFTFQSRYHLFRPTFS